ncbi:(2Fe-2S)-binding protein [Colwellia sp. E2M01]|uniref:(2Fe-2S)-binding protein n=1 Tax=Colwellia sp. E2M01 TaxID=2841561 RepID=UPI001C090AF1|nr:(2Fe-2S)-binding protein [Colwellia sp. E2M01]MBU2872169.1 (2Fe-2S)-binding protein [Colwellia sp. E2M01]
MDADRKAQDPTLVCTCSDLYLYQIQQAIVEGEDEYNEIMQYNDTLPRCGECQDHVDALVAASTIQYNDQPQDK